MKCRVFTERPSAPSPAVLAELAGLELLWLADAIGFGLVDRQIRPVFEPVPRLVGIAVTVRTAPGDFKIVPWAVDLLGPGDVLVIDGGGDDKRAIWGDFVSSRAKTVGCVGVVVDGAVRDIDGLADIGLPVFSRWTTPRGPARSGPGDVNVPISCGGVSVLPGDLVVADGAGIVVISRGDIGSALEMSRAKVAVEIGMRSRETRDDWVGYLARIGESSGAPDICRRRWDD
jgi:4-hydroxy-4-methyl-2-oxoglutarate aldolase